MNWKLICLFGAIMITVSYGPAVASGDTSLPDRAALVNGTVITREDFRSELKRVERLRGGEGKITDPVQAAKTEKEVLESLIDRELLYQEAVKNRVKIPEKAVDEEVEKLRKKFSKGVEFEATLAKMGLTEPVIRAQIGRGMTISQFIDNEFAKKEPVSEGEIASYYESHQDEFRKPRRARISQILVKADPEWDAAKKGEARERLAEVRRKLKGGEEFATLARSFSDCPSRQKGGDLGYFTPGELDKNLAEAVFALRPGETSDIVEDRFGYHLFRVTELKPEAVPPLGSVREEIRLSLQRKRTAGKLTTYLRRLREKARVEILLNEDGE